MTDDAITLHLSKAEATVPGPTLHWLPREHCYRPTCPRVDLVINHVLQALVVGGIQEDLGFELTTGMTVVHHLPATTLVPNPVMHHCELQSDCIEVKQRENHNDVHKCCRRMLNAADSTCVAIWLSVCFRQTSICLQSATDTDCMACSCWKHYILCM